MLRYAFIMLHITEADLKNNAASLIFSLNTNLRNCISLHNPHEMQNIMYNTCILHMYTYQDSTAMSFVMKSQYQSVLIYIGLHG